MFFLPIVVRVPEPAPVYVRPKPNPVSEAIASTVRVGRQFILNGKKNRNTIYTVLNITDTGFQYATKKENGKYDSNHFMSFDDCHRVMFQ